MDSLTNFFNQVGDVISGAAGAVAGAVRSIQDATMTIQPAPGTPPMRTKGTPANASHAKESDLLALKVAGIPLGAIALGVGVYLLAK